MFALPYRFYANENVALYIICACPTECTRAPFSKHAEPLEAHSKNKSWIRKFEKHLHKGPKNSHQNENSKFEIYFLTYKHLKKGLFKGASPDGKNNFF